MSHTQTAYLRRTDLPDSDRLQRAIEGLGFDLLLDESFAPERLAGWQPCLLAGEPAGVEMFLREAREAVAEYPALAATVSDREFAISLRWGGDLGECACALAIAAALAHGCGALVHDESEDSLCTASELADEARAVIAELLRG